MVKNKLAHCIRQVIILVIVLVLCSCNSTTERVNLETLDKNLYEQSWLIGKPCNAPCWNGLEPGKSSRKDSISTAKQLAFINGDSVELANSQGAAFLCKEPPDLYCVTMTFENGTLENLSITPNFDITIDQAVEKLGTPDGFLVRPMYPDAGGCRLQVIWKKQRLILEHTEGIVSIFDFRNDLCEQVKQNEGKLPPHIILERVNITNSNQMESILKGDILKIWKGFTQD